MGYADKSRTVSGTVLGVRDGTAIFELSTTSTEGEADAFFSVVVATLVALPTTFVSLVVRTSAGVVVESCESTYELAESRVTMQMTRVLPMLVASRLACYRFSIEPLDQSETGMRGSATSDSSNTYGGDGR